VIVAVVVKDVVRVAVNEAQIVAGASGAKHSEALPLGEELTGVYVTLPLIGTFEFRKFTALVGGPFGAKPMLAVLTSAVRVTDWLGVTVVWLAATPMLVPARVTVIGAAVPVREP
jgi:hypothetical protein